MVNNYRIAPAPNNVPSTIVQTLSTEANISSRVRRRHKQCLTIVVIASTLVIGVLIGATVLIWLALGSFFGTKGTISNTTIDSAQSEGSKSQVLTPSPLFGSNSGSTSAYVFGLTSVDFINTPGPGVTQNPVAATVTTKLVADSKSNFLPCPGKNQIQCRSDGKCLLATKRCNKVKDCVDGSDEYNCSCLDVLRSTNVRKICDGYSDCPSDEDEKNCAYQCQNSTDSHRLFRCSMSSECIPQSQICDGKNDCPDGQDENTCWMLAPNLDATTSSNYKTYYDFGYAFKRRNGIWYPVNANVDVTTLVSSICEQVQYKTVIYSDLRILTDNRVNGCFTTTGISNLSPTSESAFQLKPSCPNKKALYVACDDFMCGHLPDCRPPRKRIVGGTDTGPFCSPWTVALYRDGEMVCHAIVLNNLWLMTAAHCFVGSEKRRWIARLGMYRQSSWNSQTVTRRIVSVIHHPNFTDSTVETNDVALIRLDRSITFSAALQPPCMPTIDAADIDDPIDGDICTVYGWGYMIEDGLQFSDELRQVDLTVISNERCNSSPEFFRTHITSGHLCLGHGVENKDACQGDSGGPLLCARTIDRSRYLAGITSTGDGCARANAPGIWTRVNTYVDWIRSTIASSIGNLISSSTSVGSDRACTGFLCATGECIYNFFRCDGGWDCQVDGSDELYCSHDTANEVTTVNNPYGDNRTLMTSGAVSISSRCGDEENDGYLCADGVTCLPYYQRCDYVLDCPGGEDERNCFYCLETDIPCDDNRRCLPFSVAITSLSNETFGRWLRDRFDCRGAR